MTGAYPGAATGTFAQVPRPGGVSQHTGRGANRTRARRILTTAACIAAPLIIAGVQAASARTLEARAGTTASVSAPPSAPAICKVLRADTGRVALGGSRRHLTVLATGDSMIYPISEELSIERPAGMRVVVDRRDGTGLTTNTVNWHALARRQASQIKPDATVISLGGRDGGIPLLNSRHQYVECCGTGWLSLYAGLLRPLVRAYLRGGNGHIYWLLLPAPRELARAPLFEAVNDSLRLLAAEFGPALKLIPTDAVISPGGFQETITYEGLKIHPRAPDGIHLSHEGACVERSLVMEAMLADGVLRHVGT